VPFEFPAKSEITTGRKKRAARVCHVRSDGVFLNQLCTNKDDGKFEFGLNHPPNSLQPLKIIPGFNITGHFNA
jgi:hypothetical protein